MARIETMHPQSNGYPFLRGMEQLARYHDRHRAEHFFREALQRDPGLDIELRKVRESAAAELTPEALERHVDRRLRATREGEERMAARRGHAIELVEERDHVGVRDEVE